MSSRRGICVNDQAFWRVIFVLLVPAIVFCVVSVVRMLIGDCLMVLFVV